MGTKNSKEQATSSPVSAGRNQKKALADRTSEKPKQTAPLHKSDYIHQTSCDPKLFNSRTFLRSSTDPKQKLSGPAISRDLDDKWKERIRKEDSKEVKQIENFDPHELKRGILGHIDQKMSNRCTEYAGALIRRVIELTKADEFTRILNAVTSYYTSNNIGTGGPDQEKAAQLDKISTTTFKTMTTEGSLFAELLEVFEAHILFQFSGKLKRLMDLSYDPTVSTVENIPVAHKHCTSQHLKKTKLFKYLSSEENPSSEMIDETPSTLEEQPKRKSLMEQYKPYPDEYSYVYKSNMIIKPRVRVLEEHRQELEDLLHQLQIAIKLVREFLQLLLMFFLNFTKAEEDVLKAATPKIELNVLQLLFQRRNRANPFSGNVRSIVWYIVQLTNYTKYLAPATKIFSELKQGDISDHLEFSLITKEFKNFYKKHRVATTSLRASLQNLTTEEEFEDLRVELYLDFFRPTYNVDTYEFDKDKVCETFMKNIKETPVLTMHQFMNSLKQLGNLLSEAYKKGLLYSAYILYDVEAWINNNFGPVETEFLINALKLIIGSMDNYGSLVNMLIIQSFSTHVEETRFAQLFINCCVDNIGSPDPQSEAVVENLPDKLTITTHTRADTSVLNLNSVRNHSCEPGWKFTNEFTVGVQVFGDNPEGQMEYSNEHLGAVKGDQSSSRASTTPEDNTGDPKSQAGRAPQDIPAQEHTNPEQTFEVISEMEIEDSPAIAPKTQELLVQESENLAS